VASRQGDGGKEEAVASEVISRKSQRGAPWIGFQREQSELKSDKKGWRAEVDEIDMPHQRSEIKVERNL
jgi:hypothetical protein